MEIKLEQVNEVKEDTLPVIIPSEAVIVAKGTALISQFELLTNAKEPKVNWMLEVVDAGRECKALFDKDGKLIKGVIILEYGDKFKHIATNNKRSYKAQADYAKNNGIQYNKSNTNNSLIKIEETFLIPYYNYMGVIKDSRVKLQGITIYDLALNIKNIIN